MLDSLKTLGGDNPYVRWGESGPSDLKDCSQRLAKMAGAQAVARVAGLCDAAHLSQRLLPNDLNFRAGRDALASTEDDRVRDGGFGFETSRK